MKRHETTVRFHLAQDTVQQMLTEWAKPHNATVRPMGRLARQYKTAGEEMHWHIGGHEIGMGTVEVSYTPSSGRLTVMVHDNRQGTWAGRAWKDLAEYTEKKIGKRSVR